MLEKTTLNNGKEVTYTYDTFGRITGKELILGTDKELTNTYTYEASDRGSGYTTTKIETETIGNTKYKYTYDNYGNITCIYKVNSDNTETILYSYVYDSYNQLTTVNDYEHSEQTTYTYNQAGNITRRNRYQMNASWVTTATLESVRYVYGDSEWKDLLTTYNGQTITYDAIGNPLNYRDGIALTWQNGRKLASYSDSNNNITYTYDASGMRTGKVVTTSEGTSNSYTYVYENGLLLQMRMGSRIYDFSYDANGTPVSIAYRTRATATPTYYYYGVNSRGDVELLYNSSGSVVAVYKYDAYGKLNSVENANGVAITSATHIANMNPLRYRSYIYDNETGFYYLQTRYYDPTTCRFINADGQLNIDSFNGFNQFAYCNGNPIASYDPVGTRTFECCPYGDCYYCKLARNVGAAKPYVDMPGSDDPTSPNCYAYAIGSSVNEQPGKTSGRTPTKWNDVNDVGKSVEADLKAKGYTVREISGPNAKVYENEFKIALRVGTQPYAYNPHTGQLYYDYHFMRQTNTGQWAEKHGCGGASILWDTGMTPDTIPWTLGGVPYYDSEIIYYAVGEGGAP